MKALAYRFAIAIPTTAENEIVNQRIYIYTHTLSLLIFLSYFFNLLVHDVSRQIEPGCMAISS